MPTSTVRTFTEPDAYLAGIPTAEVKGVVTARGRYRAELIQIGLNRLFMQRGAETLPRVANVATLPQPGGLLFATDPNQPAFYFDGIEVSPSEIIFFGLGSVDNFRFTAASQWGDVSLMREDLIAAEHTIIARELTLPFFPGVIRPPAALLSRLRNLHQAAGDLAKTAPDILANPEVTRAMEQALVEAMVSCLANGDSIETRRSYRHHARVMRRFEEAIQANPEGPLYITELCAALGVSNPTLRACCQEHLGMSPKRYLLLRRLNLVRRALSRTGPQGTTVTEIAGTYGFWELGRFSVMYRSLFGESPSQTLHRPPKDPQPAEIDRTLREFIRTA